MLNPWLAFSFKVFQLGIEAQSVVALRMMRLASGGAGTQAEMGRMMVEKAAAVTEAQFAAANRHRRCRLQSHRRAVNKQPTPPLARQSIFRLIAQLSQSRRIPRG